MKIMTPATQVAKEVALSSGLRITVPSVGEMASFWVSGLASPFVSWGIRATHLAAHPGRRIRRGGKGWRRHVRRLLAAGGSSRRIVGGVTAGRSVYDTKRALRPWVNETFGPVSEVRQ